MPLPKRPPPPISGPLYKGLVGILSGLGVDGTIANLRNRAATMAGRQGTRQQRTPGRPPAASRTKEVQPHHAEVLDRLVSRFPGRFDKRA